MTSIISDEPERVISSEVVYRGKVLSLRRDKVELPTGWRTSREIVEHPGSVAVVPILHDGIGSF